MKSIILSFVLALPVFGQAWNYIGIPYPTDAVPYVFGNTLPDGTDTTLWAIDPCTIATPVFADGASQYYVDTVNGVDASAGNSLRGSVAAPRKTVPTLTTLTAGTQIFITENSTFGNGDTVYSILGTGTSSNPIWIIGLGAGPKWRGEMTMGPSLSYFFFDNIRFERIAGQDQISLDIDGTNICVRNSTVHGGNQARNSCVKGSGEAVVIYNNTFKKFGNYLVTGSKQDRHCIQPLPGANHWWIVGNDISETEGDGIQINSSKYYPADSADLPHYMYIAGNRFSYHLEQGVDCKTAMHVFIVENHFSFCSGFPLTGSSNKDAMLLVNNDEGSYGSLYWAIGNFIDQGGRAGRGIKVAGGSAETVDNLAGTPPVQTQGCRVFAIGNVMIGVETGFFQEAKECDNNDSPSPTPVMSWPTEVWYVDNTVYASGLLVNQTASAQNVAYPLHTRIIGNVLHTTGSNAGVAFRPNYDGQFYSGIENLWYYSGGATAVPTSTFDTYTGNVIDQNPAFLGASDPRLAASSPARNIVATRPACYQTFEDLYGINIDVSLNGVARSTSADAGAYEWVAGQPGLAYDGALLLEPTGLPVSTSAAGISFSTQD